MFNALIKALYSLFSYLPYFISEPVLKELGQHLYIHENINNHPGDSKLKIQTISLYFKKIIKLFLIRSVVHIIHSSILFITVTGGPIRPFMDILLNVLTFLVLWNVFELFYFASQSVFTTKINPTGSFKKPSTTYTKSSTVKDVTPKKLTNSL